MIIVLQHRAALRTEIKQNPKNYRKKDRFIFNEFPSIATTNAVLKIGTEYQNKEGSRLYNVLLGEIVEESD